MDGECLHCADPCAVTPWRCQGDCYAITPLRGPNLIATRNKNDPLLLPCVHRRQTLGEGPERECWEWHRRPPFNAAGVQSVTQYQVILFDRDVCMMCCEDEMLFTRTRTTMTGFQDMLMKLEIQDATEDDVEKTKDGLLI